LVEVTMALGRAQTVMEVWPIERHLEDFQKHQESQCIFVAPSIYADSKRQIKFVAQDSHGERIIRPYAIPELINYLERCHNLFDFSYRSERDIQTEEQYGLPWAAEEAPKYN